MADYTDKAIKAKDKLRKKGMQMVFVRSERDKKAMPVPGMGYPIKETRTTFYGLRTKPTAVEVTLGLFTGADAIVILPYDCGGKDAQGNLVIPTTEDVLEFNGKKWGMSKIYPVAPTENAIIYKVSVMESGNV